MAADCEVESLYLNYKTFFNPTRNLRTFLFSFTQAVCLKAANTFFVSDSYHSLSYFFKKRKFSWKTDPELGVLAKK